MNQIARVTLHYSKMAGMGELMVATQKQLLGTAKYEYYMTVIGSLKLAHTN